MEKSAINSIIQGLGSITPDDAAVLSNAVIALIDRSRFINVEIEKISLTVAAASTLVTAHQFTSVRHKRIVGIACSIRDTAALETATFYLDIDGKEVFADGCELALLVCNSDVAPNQKYYTFVDREINQTPINIRLTPSAVFTSSYQVNFYFLCQKV